MTELTVLAGLRYAEADGAPLALDLYRPGPGPVPVTVYLHGGGWARGGKEDDRDTRLRGLARHGIAVASVQYRLVPGAVYPAQLHDAKGAVRWLRAHGAELGLDTAAIGAWGASAGGYLASMLGLTAGAAGLEGTTGGNLGHSSAVQAVVPWFAPAESAALHDALARAGASSTLVTLGGAGHEDPRFDSPAHLAMTAAFLAAALAPVPGG